MPTPLHNAITNELAGAFNRAELSVPQMYGLTIGTLSNEEYLTFEGSHANSTKIPDLGVEFEFQGVLKLRLGVEVGFTETYDHLKDSARLWLEGYPSVVLVVLIKLLEQPRYQSPLRELDDEEIKELSLPATSTMRNEIMGDSTVPPLGPVHYRGAQWTGRLAGVWVERWSRDENGKAHQTGPGQVRRFFW